MTLVKQHGLKLKKPELDHKRVPWNKGKRGIYSAETLEKMSRARKGKPSLSCTKFANGHSPWNKGISVRLSPATEFKKGQSMGAEHPRWKGGVSKQKGYNAIMESRRSVRKRGNGGSHTLQEWEDLKKLYDFMCLCCKQQEPFIKLTRDHILPIARGGSDHITNIQPLCGPCNFRKYTKAINYINSTSYVGNT